jgi:shikimate kinase
MGVGKSTIGRKLARQLNFEFIDLDDIFEQKYKISIDSFFNKYDEELFRRLEHEMLLDTFLKEKAVISTGGGTPCYHNAMEKINSVGYSIYIKMPPSAIAHRLSTAKKKRPLIQGIPKEDLEHVIREKLDGRHPIYKQAQLHVNGIEININELAETIRKNNTIS